MQCSSFCSYPHGMWITLGFLVACMGAVATTTYAVASCRFVVVEFDSSRGDFEEVFDLDARVTDVLSNEKVGAGLFVWLQPHTPESSWDNGNCVGYTERHRDNIADATFEAARFMGVLSVLFGFVVLVWALVLSCMRLVKWQHVLLQCMLLLLTIMTCLTFLIKKSALCQDVEEDTSCRLDEGGLVNIAGALLWFTAFLVAAVFLRVSSVSQVTVRRRPQDDDDKALLRQRRRRRERRRREREEQRERDEEDAQVVAAATAAAAAVDINDNDVLPSTPDTKASPDLSLEDDTDDVINDEEAEEGGLEVYIGKFLDKIECLVDGS